jgi:hypothetical protein
MKCEKDYYQVLGLSSQATSVEIRQAYRRLAILNHPDRNPSTQATLRMQEINEAYRVLGEKRKRIKYDSERGNPSPRTQTTSTPRRTRATANLQQIFAEDIIRRMGFLPLLIALAVLLVSTGLLYSSVPPYFWSMLQAEWWWWTKVFLKEGEPAIFVLFTVVLSLASVGGILFRMLSKFRKIETQCPKCRKDGAAEKLASISQNTIHYRCKYCFYEWQFIKINGQSIS